MQWQLSLKDHKSAHKVSNSPSAIAYMFSLSVANSSDRLRIERAYFSFVLQFEYELRSEAF